MTKNNFQSEFLAFKDELNSFLFRLLTNRQDAEDIVQDTFIKVSEKLDTYDENYSFKTWVFTIGINQAKNHLKRRNRWVEHAQDSGANLHIRDSRHAVHLHQIFQSTPDREFEIREHITYCFNCINKTLEQSQQICLLLKEIYTFKVSEIMQITGLSEGKVKHAIADARKNMMRIFDQRCAFINKNGICHQCTSLKGILNPKQDAHIKAREIKLVQNGDSADKEYLLNLRLNLAKEINPLKSKNTALHSYFLENSESWVDAENENPSLKK